MVEIKLVPRAKQDGRLCMHHKLRENRSILEATLTNRFFLFLFPLYLFATLAAAQNAKNETFADSIKLMDKQWIIEAYSSKDLKDFDRIVADDFLITSGSGKLQNKAEK